MTTRLAGRDGIAAALASVALVLASSGIVRGDAALTGAVRVSPLVVSLVLSASIARIGDTVRADVTVINGGSTTIRDVRVELRADPNGLRITGSTGLIGQLKPGKSAVLKWSLCGGVAGTYIVLARATAGGTAIESPASGLTIQPGGRRTCS